MPVDIEKWRANPPVQEPQKLTTAASTNRFRVLLIGCFHWLRSAEEACSSSGKPPLYALAVKYVSTGERSHFLGHAYIFQAESALYHERPARAEMGVVLSEDDSVREP